MTTESHLKRLGPALACAAAGFVLFQYWGNATHGYIVTNSLFYWWGFQWVNADSETEHGWLVLALAIFIWFRNLGLAKDDGRRDDGRAFAAILCALVLHALGFIAQQPRVSILALLFYCWGVLGLAGGRRWSKASAFPLAFLVFAIPISALDSISFWLRMGVVRTGAAAAHLMGIGVLRNGTQLIAPDGRYQYDVVAACSGVRSLVALAALSLFIGYLWFRPLWLRCFIFALSLPLVFASNVVRIVSIIVAAKVGGQAAGDRVHDVMGYAVFIIVMGGVLAAADFISRKFPRLSFAAADPAAETPNAGAAGLSRSALVAVVLLAASADAAFLAYRSGLPPNEKTGVLLAAGGANPIELPTFLDSGWMGSAVEPTAVERSILPPDTGYSRKLYLSQSGPSRQTLLSIVLSGRDRTSLHRPELCLVGQGWTIDGSSLHSFAYPGKNASGFDATVLHVHRNSAGYGGRGEVPEIVVYWYVGGDRIVPSQVQRMAYDSWNRVLHGRADRWAYVLLMTDAEDGEAAALARIQGVLNSTLPSFQPALAR
ncbi:MAG TPA: exosortase/archaeosortase family protein [Opitutaceae bacterium]